MTYARSQMAGPRPSADTIPKSPHARGAIEDAKFYALNYSIPANSRVTYDLDATAFYVDNGPANLGDIEYSVDDCFPDMGFRYGLFVRLRRFTRIHLSNLTAGTLDGRLIYSLNPDFLVMQFQV